MNTKKVLSIQCCGITIERAEVIIKKPISPITKPVIAIFGGLEISKSINKSLLKSMCHTIGERLGKNKYNILTTGAPGIVNWVASSAAKNGAKVWTILNFARKNDHNAEEGDVTIYTSLDRQFISFMMGYIADIGITIGGEIGTMIKSSVLADLEKPLVCLKNTGGMAARFPTLIREAIHDYQDLNLYEVETVTELMRVLNRLTEGKVILESKLQRIVNQIT